MADRQVHMKFGGNAGASVDAYLEYKRYILVGPFGPSSIRPTTTILIRRTALLFTCNPCKESLSDTEMVPLHKWGSNFIPVAPELSVLTCMDPGAGGGGGGGWGGRGGGVKVKWPISKKFFNLGAPIFTGGGGGGSNCLFPIESSHITWDFQEGFRTPCPPRSGSTLD